MLKAWDTFADDYLFSATEVAHASHGRRLYDTLKEYCRINDEDKLQVGAPCSPFVLISCRFYNLFHLTSAGALLCSID